MSALGRLTNAFISASNENTLALASVNFDFSLMKFEAPKEFQIFGASLSQRRRDEAEEGATHRVARRLGALFDRYVPQTPNLVKVYGQRASEIAANPKANPRGSKKDGPLEAYIGADGTSLWAAATSSQNDSRSHPPLAMHLLACMLARVWNPEEAVAIWVELVRTRRQEVESSLDTEPQSLSACMAARQEISREQLALWDASARSWLRSADEVNSINRTRLQLLVNNMHLTFTHKKNTYESVLAVWRHAMLGIEKSVIGTPQEASDGSILLALSAWHIYPNLIVLGLGYESVEKLTFDDPLVPSEGVLTIGLEFAPGTRPAGVHWSLLLSHLRHYGGAVSADSSSELQRITMTQLLVMVFGDVLASWEIPRDADHEKLCAQWLCGEWLNDLSYEPMLEMNLGWLSAVVAAARAYLELNEMNSRFCSMLTTWGRRRCKTFTSRLDQKPFFGLYSYRMTSALQNYDILSAGIHYLRCLASDLNLSASDCVIRYRVGLRRNDYVELISAVPHAHGNVKRTYEGEPKRDHAHCRWLGFNADRSIDVHRTSCECFQCGEACPCASSIGMCREGCHAGRVSACCRAGPMAEERARLIRSTTDDEVQFLEPHQTTTDNHRSSGGHIIQPGALIKQPDLIWNNPPALYHNHSNPVGVISDCESLKMGVSQCTCFLSCHEYSEYYHSAHFRLLNGDWANLGLFVRVLPSSYDVEDKFRQKEQELRAVLREAVTAEQVSARELTKNITLGQGLLGQYFQCLASSWPSTDQNLARSIRKPASTGRFELRHLLQLEGIFHLNEPYVESMRALRFAVGVYKDLDGATIPLRVLDQPLCHARFLASLLRLQVSVRALVHVRKVEDVIDVAEQSRTVRFACIALFESGIHNIRTDELKPVVAIASANSLFVAAEMVSDPQEECSGRIKRVTGNVGRAGISMLVLPQVPPRIRALGHDWRAVPHEDYDGKREDSFGHSNLVLSFTEWARPLQAAQRGTIDEDLHFVECVVSIHDKGIWVADINPIGVEATMNGLKCACDAHDRQSMQPPTSIDSWEELLDAPDNIGIFRAHGNTFARLAALAIRAQQGIDTRQRTYVIRKGETMCVTCCAKLFRQHTGNPRGVIID